VHDKKCGPLVADCFLRFFVFDHPMFFAMILRLTPPGFPEHKQRIVTFREGSKLVIPDPHIFVGGIARAILLQLLC
jgi:hypothetical protein